MNAPLRWPNRWLSARSFGTAVQLKGTNGRVARADAPWITRATISLPVPVSPVSSTVIDMPATRRALATSVVISLLQKTKSSGGSPASNRPEGHALALFAARLALEPRGRR